jgi:hypothetical protein
MDSLPQTLTETLKVSNPSKFLPKISSLAKSNTATKHTHKQTIQNSLGIDKELAYSVEPEAPKAILKPKAIKKIAPQFPLQQNKLVIQANPPSIPYKDSAFGYEPLDNSGRLLVNVGNSFKETYKDQYNSTPGPGTYETAMSYIKKNIGTKISKTKRADFVKPG